MAKIKGQKLFLVTGSKWLQESETKDVWVAAKDFGEAAIRGKKAIEAEGWYDPTITEVRRRGTVY